MQIYKLGICGNEEISVTEKKKVKKGLKLLAIYLKLFPHRKDYLRPMILVTGGTGMIGARLIFDLARQGHTLRALRREGSDTRLFDQYTNGDKAISEQVEWVTGDLLDLDSLENALEGIDTVFHCAALVSFSPTASNFMEKVNREGTANLVNLCLDKPGFRYFAHVSSVATLGRTSGEQPLDESSNWDPSLKASAYAVSKYGAEREVWRAIAEQLPAVIVNPSIVLGPGDFSKGSAELFSKIQNGFPFYTEGVSGFVDVRDVSKALIYLWKKGITGQRYLLNSENMSYKVLFEKMARALGVKAPSIKIKAWMTALVWPLDYLRCKITGGKPFITRDTARSSRSRYFYTSDKIKNMGFEFIPIDDCIRHSIQFLKK